jgi:hypothetical protein
MFTSTYYNKKHYQNNLAIMAEKAMATQVEIVGTLMGDRGRSCEEHVVCGSVLEEDMVVRLRKVQVLADGQEKTAIACYWVTDGIDCCRVGFLMRHMIAHAARYNRALAQVTRVFSGKEEECSREERRMYHAKRGYCQATIISCFPMKEDGAKTKKKAKSIAGDNETTSVS